jgi:hypothetical protein
MGKLSMKKINVVIFIASSTLFFGISSAILSHSVNKEGDSQKKEAIYSSKFNGISISEVLSNSKVYESLEELETDAEIILIGTPVTNISESKTKVKKAKFGSKEIKPTEKSQNNKSPEPEEYFSGESYITTFEDGSISSYSSILEVKVQKVIKGNINEKTIELVEPAALVQSPDGSQYIISSEDYTPAQENTKYIFFLASTNTLAEKYAEIYERNGYKNEIPGKYITLSPGFSKYNLDLNDNLENEKFKNNPILNKIKEKVSNKYKKVYEAANKSE